MVVIKDEVLQGLVVLGSSARCATAVQRYLGVGTDVITLARLPHDEAGMPE